ARAAVGRLGYEQITAARVRPESKDITKAVGLDVAANPCARSLGTAHLDRCLPSSRRSSAAVDKDGGTIVPDYVDIVFESRSWAMINPHNLLVGVRLAAGERGIKFPGGTEIIRPIGTQLKRVTLNA